ncbi:UNC93-like protein MFSD11 [Thrips palmi]|uniref:UNC93-like protein MFSD11 n=1 Tax=Thrips palmi TaxID=161013 RepID=A0A6P8ZRN5_THRPL|nr:UNC93-like protein MFSD11 [Thrips palmi]
MDRGFLNVILLGFGFMFVFTAFQTMGNIEQTVLDSIHADDPSFTGKGYTSLAVIYAVFAVCNWAAPSIISVIGPRAAICLGAVTYGFFIATFLYPSTWLLYASSAVIGFGAAVIWTGQGSYLTLNSTKETISRNSGVFWAMLQCSMFFGNIFVTFMFQGKTHIDEPTRRLVFSVLLGVAALGFVFVLLLRPAVQTVEMEKRDKSTTGPMYALKRAGHLSLTKNMALLSVTFFYTGLELSFFSGVYSPSIGFTKQMGENAKQLVGLSGIFIGLGEVIGGALFGLLGRRTTRSGRDPIVIMGFLIHAASFFLIFLNLPNNANLGDTSDDAYITSNQYVALLCSFLLGFGDSCFNTQIFSILGGLYPEDSAPVFALFKFTQSVSAAISFFYSTLLGLYVQLGILVVSGTVGTVTFCLVEWSERYNKKSESPINSESSDPDNISPRTPALPHD